MLDNFPYNLKLPPYTSVKEFEGRGNFAIKAYYQFPRNLFYSYKLRLIVDLMDRRYKNIMDFGSGPGIFYPELKRHSTKVFRYDQGDAINPMWKFDCIVCASVLEFCELKPTLIFLRKLLDRKGQLLIGSPMDTKISRFYFRLIGDKHHRHSHKEIYAKVLETFGSISLTYKEWMGLYFTIKVVNI